MGKSKIIISLKLLNNYNISDVVVMSLIFYRYFSYKNGYKKINVENIAKEIKLGKRQVYNIIKKMEINELIKSKVGKKNSKLYIATDKFKNIMFFQNGYFYVHLEHLNNYGYKEAVVYGFFLNKWDYWTKNSKIKYRDYIYIDMKYLQRQFSISKNSLLNIFEHLKKHKLLYIKSKGYPRRRYYKLNLLESSEKNNKKILNENKTISSSKISYSKSGNNYGAQDNIIKTFYKRFPFAISFKDKDIKIYKDDVAPYINGQNLKYNSFGDTYIIRLKKMGMDLFLDYRNIMLYPNSIKREYSEEEVTEVMRKMVYRLNREKKSIRGLLMLKSELRAFALNEEYSDELVSDFHLAFFIAFKKFQIPPYRFIQLLEFIFTDNYWKNQIHYLYNLYNISPNSGKYIIEIINEQLEKKFQYANIA